MCIRDRLRNICGHTATPLAYTVIGRYHHITEGLTSDVVSVDDGVDSVCCCWSSLMPTSTDSDIFWTICPEFFRSYFIFSDPFLHVHLSAHRRPCWALFLGTTSPAANGFIVWSLMTSWLRDETRMWRVVDELTHDELTVWRVDR